MPKPLDLKGKKINKWTVIEKAKSRKDKAYWLCKCDCGEMREIQATSLVNERSYSCGKCKNSRDFNGTLKKCDICKKEFITIRYGQKRRFCFECSPYGESKANSITTIRKAIKQQLVKYKGGKCEICGYNKCLNAMQFHHKDMTNKDFTISANIDSGDFNMKSYYAEVDKCLLVCANCHAEIHANYSDK